MSSERITCGGYWHWVSNTSTEIATETWANCLGLLLKVSRSSRRNSRLRWKTRKIKKEFVEQDSLTESQTFISLSRKRQHAAVAGRKGVFSFQRKYKWMDLILFLILNTLESISKSFLEVNKLCAHETVGLVLLAIMTYRCWARVCNAVRTSGEEVASGIHVAPYYGDIMMSAANYFTSSFETKQKFLPLVIAEALRKELQ